MTFEQEKKHHINKPLIEQLRNLYAEVNVLGAPDSAITDDYSRGYNAALDRVLRILGAAGFEEGKSTAADEINGFRMVNRELCETLEMLCKELRGMDLDRQTLGVIKIAEDAIAKAHTI